VQAGERGIDAVCGQRQQGLRIAAFGPDGATAVSSSVRRSNTSTTVGRTNSMSGSSSVLCAGRGNFSTRPMVS
jgi:hypothetical protein